MKKFVLLGIDGVPFELVEDFSKKGITPNLGKLARKGSFIKTQAPFPEVSSVSWSSFMTAKNPGAHGIYGFVELDGRTYEYRFPNFLNLKEKPFWEKESRRAVIINLPQTYPARRINGILISGFVALSLEKAVYPPALLPLLRRLKYKVDVNASLGKSDKDKFINELFDILKIREKVMKKLWKKDWDIFFLVITGTDRLHHFLFDAYESESHPYRKAFESYYREVDRIAGKLADMAERRDLPLAILSDHGFCGIKQEVYLSQYLRKWGFLNFDENKPGNLTSISPSSRVFALDPSRIYIHLKGKYSRGKVEPSEYEKLIEELKKKFLSIEIDGQKVIKAVFHKDEIYSGPYLNSAPDLVLLSNHGFDLKSGTKAEVLHGKTHFTGMHTQDNAFLITYPKMEFPFHPFIYQVSARITSTIETPNSPIC